MKVWVTKYALTSGIMEVNVEQTETASMVRLAANQETGFGFSQYFHGEGRDWHQTAESAATKAKDMRAKKIAALRKQITKLEGLIF